MPSGRDILVVLHDVSSVQRLLDMARLVYGFGLKTFIATKVYGAAATNGIPEAMKLALKSNASFIVLPGLRDAVELFQPSHILVVSHEYGEPIDPGQLREINGRVMIVFGGSESSPTREDAAIGKPVYPRGLSKRIGAIGEAAVILYASLVDASQ